jgi:phosphatidate cytidylyltransferase
VRSRVFTAIGLMPIVLGALFCASPWPIWLLAWIAGLLCIRELSTILKRKHVWYGVIITLSLLTPWPFQPLFAGETAAIALLTLLIGVGATFACARFMGRADPPTSHASHPAIVFSSLWITAPMFALKELHSLAPAGNLWVFANPVLMAILPLWGGDTAAMLIGKTFGKHRLAPLISPKKTVEGSVANLLACVLVSAPLAAWIGYSWWIGALCGLLAGVFGQLGDLFESYLKRQAGVKDSGSILPGHGGLLDRIDSVLFTAPLVYTVLAFIRLH